MSVSLKQSYDIEYNGSANVARMDLFVDTADDLTGLTTFDSITLLQGSTAEDISTGDKYMMQTNGTWVKQPSQSAFANVYTKSEIDSMFYLYYTKTEADALFEWITVTITTDTLPLEFIADGTPLISLSILGNGQQTGTPTPDNPVMPTFCGVRTGNLWDEDYTGISNSIKYVPIYVGNGDYTLSSSIPNGEGGVKNLFLLSGSVSSGASSASNGVALNHSKTVTAINGYVTIAFRSSSGGAPYNPANYDTMLNLGSTALPYEPFGWAEKITCGGETTSVYLGQTQTVRRIKKLVLDGTENWGQSSDGNIYIALSPNKGVAWVRVLSTHFTSSQIQTNGNLLWFVNANVDFDTVEECKTYLAAQYAAGTPVTVWYVLATQTTGIVNEPLAKIGDYADELRSTDAAVTIPTAKGSNTLTVGTTLQPSEMTITGKIREVTENEQ